MRGLQLTNCEQELPSSSILNTQTTHLLEEEGLGGGFHALSASAPPSHAVVTANFAGWLSRLVLVFLIRPAKQTIVQSRLPNLVDRSGEYCVYILIAFPLHRREWHNKPKDTRQSLSTPPFSLVQRIHCIARSFSSHKVCAS